MAWVLKDVAGSGEYLEATLTGGSWIDPFGSVNIADMTARITQQADGWSLLNIQWVHGLFGFGESLKIYGRANGPVPTALVGSQIVEALNSYWAIGGAEVSVAVSDSISTLIPAGNDNWSGTVKIVAFAAIALAIVWGIHEGKGILK